MDARIEQGVPQAGLEKEVRLRLAGDDAEVVVTVRAAEVRDLRRDGFAEAFGDCMDAAHCVGAARAAKDGRFSAWALRAMPAYLTVLPHCCAWRGEPPDFEALTARCGFAALAALIDAFNELCFFGHAGSASALLDPANRAVRDLAASIERAATPGAGSSASPATSSSGSATP